MELKREKKEKKNHNRQGSEDGSSAGLFSWHGRGIIERNTGPRSGFGLAKGKARQG
jgi:hypothetical protein